MRRSRVFLFAAVLLLTGTGRADLIVHEYVSGQRVTLNANTGNYWYWNLADFQDMTYAEQISAIEDLNHNNYGYIAGGWHFATRQEMRRLWDYLAPEIGAAFGPSLVEVNSYYWSGRYRRFVPQTPAHYHAYISCSFPGPVWQKTGLMDSFVYNDAHGGMVGGAWVTTDAPVIPAPPAVILAVSGLLTVLGVNRWRRKR